ncbi:MAG: hypothetical protein L6Q92_15245 [Phycisphaerae bacterium]|nr:hypothetical protein [Phycisphaerae bacterium]
MRSFSVPHLVGFAVSLAALTAYAADPKPTDAPTTPPAPASPTAPQSATDAPKKPRTPLTDPTNPGVWDADHMMEEAVLTLSRRYGLNPEQEQYTRVLLVNRTRKFLKQHESDLRQLIKESFDLQMGRVPPTPENYKSWSQRARPVFESAKKEILDGNAEWGTILDENQKRIHRMDLDQMAVSFRTIDGLITKWSGGNFQPTDLAPRPPSSIAQGSGDSQHMVSDKPPTVVRAMEDLWEMYVRKAIETYNFTDAQRNSAFAILQQCRNRAKDYRASRKTEFDTLETQIREATRQGESAARIESMRTALSELETPIGEIFADLRNRLDQIPTKAQRESVSEAALKMLNALADAQTNRSSLSASTPSASAPAKPMNRRDLSAKPPASQPAPSPPDAEAAKPPSPPGKLNP